MYQYYEKLVTLREGMHKRSKETKNLSRVDIFTVKE
jgi:hypothetical protein